MKLEFKIGMVAPAGAGKTSLLGAIYEEVKQRVVQDNLKFRPTDDETQRSLTRSLSNFRARIDSDKDMFDVPTLTSTENISTYTFTLLVPGGNDEQDVQFSVMDYPGGMIGKPEFERQVAPHLKESVALLVPIPAEYVMTWFETKGKKDQVYKHELVRSKLQVDEVIQSIVEWIKYKVDEGLFAQLIFVPVKCEKYFTDNCGQFSAGLVDKSKDLAQAVFQLYIQSLENQLRKTFTNPQDLDKINHLIPCEIFSVDTYGVVELSRVEMIYDDHQQPSEVKSVFKRRIGMGNDIQMKNAYELLIDIVQFQLEGMEQMTNRSMVETNSQYSDFMKNRPWWDIVKDYSFGWLGTSERQKLQDKVNDLQTSHACALRALEHLRSHFQLMPARQLCDSLIGTSTEQ